MTHTFTEKDMRALAVEVICFVQQGKWYNGKVDDKLADEVAARLMWGPCTAWMMADRVAYRQWMDAKRQQPQLPRVLPPSELPRITTPPMQLPRVLPPSELPRITTPPTLPRVLPLIKP